MKRRLFNILAVASLVLCVATAALWIISFWARSCGVRAGFARFVLGRHHEVRAKAVDIVFATYIFQPMRSFILF